MKSLSEAQRFVRCLRIEVFLFACLFAGLSQAAEPTRNAVESSLEKAIRFYRDEVANQGGYVYRYSSDLTLREAEGLPDENTIWIQPPGTPAVGEAFLDAYEATKEPAFARAALDAAEALVKTQLQSGGWYYHGHFDPETRREFFYRRTLAGELVPDPTPAADRQAPNGWELWRQGDYRGRNQTILDDDVTQSALRFLMRFDQLEGFRNEAVHDAVTHGLDALVKAQYPNGGWSANFDRFPDVSPSAETYTVLPASYPETWSRTWPKAYDGPYVTNDNLMANVIATLIRAVETYGDREPSYRRSLLAAGDFLIRAQMPDPQPAWAQHYNRDMQPTWDRAFEPPAISGRESQEILAALVDLSRTTGETRFLEPLPRAIAYLKKSRLTNGKLARFYELETNRPLFFTRGPGGKGWEITYQTDRLASNYGWEWESRLEAIEAEAQRVRDRSPEAPLSPTERAELTNRVTAILSSQDDRGAWTSPGTIRDADGRKVEPVGGIIESATFIENVKTLSDWLVVAKQP
ncbi:MAG: polysaccharide lyase [Verrucomicrobiae bacterium]|nr:polysaccharide lyase [Verrucomicrobiae bacterium]